jgi:hypothetical protein
MELLLIGLTGKKVWASFKKGKGAGDGAFFIGSKL